MLLFRADASQFLHDFESALKDLDAVLRTHPRRAQAWLMRANILQVQGQYAEARAAAVRLVTVAPQLISVGCASGLAAVTGSARQGYAVLEETLTRSSLAPASERRWAHTILAETAASLEQTFDAERHFRAALELEPQHAYTLAAYADFLMDQDRPMDVVRSLRGKDGPESVLLRLAWAERTISPQGGSWRELAARLRGRLESTDSRGEPLHRREYAMLLLRVLGQPRLALSEAKLNWETQKELADARILLEAAAALGDSESARPVLNWMTATRIEDVRLHSLARRHGSATL